MVEFRIDDVAKKAISRQRVVSTTGGKIALGLSLCCLPLAGISYMGVLAMCEPMRGRSVSESFPETMALAVAAVFLVFAVAGVLATFRQRNVGAAMRKKESLRVGNGWLDYSFQPSADRFPNGRNVVRIDLPNSSIALDRKQKAYVFAGAVYGARYDDFGRQRLRSLNEMERLPKFEIGAYFGAEFDALMAMYMGSTQDNRA